jgi:hypothetical protein
MNCELLQGREGSISCENLRTSLFTSRELVYAMYLSNGSPDQVCAGLRAAFLLLAGNRVSKDKHHTWPMFGHGKRDIRWLIDKQRWGLEV